MTCCYVAPVTPGARYLTAAVITGVAAAGAAISPPARASEPAAVASSPTSLRQAHATLDGLQAAVRGGKQDLLELKTRAAKLGFEISRALAVDAAHTNRLRRERSFVLDELSTLQSVLPAVQGQRHALAHAVQDAELAYLDCEVPELNSVPQPEVCSDRP